MMKPILKQTASIVIAAVTIGAPISANANACYDYCTTRERGICDRQSGSLSIDGLDLGAYDKCTSPIHEECGFQCNSHAGGPGKRRLPTVLPLNWFKPGWGGY